MTAFAILFLQIGIVLLGLGVIGEYIGRIYQEVRKRPRFVVRTGAGAVDGVPVLERGGCWLGISFAFTTVILRFIRGIQS